MGLSFKDGVEVKWYAHVDVGRGGCVTANFYKEKFWFGKVETLHNDEVQVWVWNVLPPGHFEEVADDVDEFYKTGRKGLLR